jgi:hypothetical protein
MFCKKLLWYYDLFGHNKFSDLCTLIFYTLYYDFVLHSGDETWTYT